MGKRSTISGYWRQRAGTPNPAVFMALLPISFDPTAANTTGTGVYLPAGAIPIGVIGQGGATGGTNPTVDIGLEGGNVDGLAAEMAADAAYVPLAGTGTELGVALTAQTEITAGVGAAAATGGTFSGFVAYIMQDDGKLND